MDDQRRGDRHQDSDAERGSPPKRGHADDGAAKERFVVVPRGAKLTARADGDLVFPVGTVAVKTFAVDGKRVETRLLVQHDLEDWTG